MGVAFLGTESSIPLKDVFAREIFAKGDLPGVVQTIQQLLNSAAGFTPHQFSRPIADLLILILRYQDGDEHKTFGTEITTL